MQLKSRLKKFTTLPVVLDMLSERRITLLNPRTWEDRNDSFYIEQYKSKKELKSVLALCFTSRPETFHHWKVFSSGSCGACIEFDKNLLLKSFSAMQGIRSGFVEYKLIKELSAKPPKTQTWPFLKRKPFADEQEFRIIFESDTLQLESKDVDLDLAAIKRVTLSPWLPKAIAESVKLVIKGIRGCKALTVSQSHLVDTVTWRNAVLADRRLVKSLRPERRREIA